MNKEDKKTEKLIEKAVNPPPAPIRRGPISRIRKEITKVSTLTPLAVENLKKHLKGEKIDKELVASSKWALENLVDFYNAATSEERIKNARVETKAASRQSAKAGPPPKKAALRKAEPPVKEETPTRFSLTMEKDGP